MRPQLLLVALVVLAVGCAGGATAAECDLPEVRSGLCPVPEEDRREAPEEPMPVVGEDDRELGLADFTGQVVVVNFWASWCGPCRLEQPDLNEAYEALPREDVAFLGVNIEDSEPNAMAHQREFDIPYPSLFDPTNDYAARFADIGPRNIPSTLIIDREGRVAVRVFGVIGRAETVALATAIADED